ncbi:MAG: beta-lactamase family protein, partial [Gemmatimonadales bacterium]|nr:beta-lactamase family protein [Gemmatimonadales bacterium]
MTPSIAHLLLALQFSGSAPAPPFAPVAALVERGIRQGVYPGAVVVIGRRDTLLYSQGFGRLSWNRNSGTPSAATTRWDLASLTKVMATASAAMVLVDRGRLDLDAPVFQYLPRFAGEGRERITARMLLDHTSGLRAYLPLYRAPNRNAALDLLYGEAPVRSPGRSPVYSDLNAILLGELVEALSGEPLDVFAGREVFTPLRLAATAFAPAVARGATVAPSRSERGRPAPGRVSDLNAAFLGGIAGHAGLFSTG